MKLELSPEEAKLLRVHLTRRITEMDHELVRTDQHKLQHELARDIDHLRDIERRLADLIAAG